MPAAEKWHPTATKLEDAVCISKNEEVRESTHSVEDLVATACWAFVRGSIWKDADVVLSEIADFAAIDANYISRTVAAAS